MPKRIAKVERKTGETNIKLELNLDGSGKWKISTGISMLDHLISQLAQHGRFDLKITASGDDQHHVSEDIGICLGKAFGQALGDNRSIVRMGNSAVPMDEAMVMVAVDFSGRAYSKIELPFSNNDMAGFSTDLIRHFLESFAAEGKMNLHVRTLYGVNDHHKAESAFKALGRALDAATRIDERLKGKTSSTKGMIEKG